MDKSAFVKSILHSVEIAVVCLVVLGILWLASLIHLIEIHEVKDAILPLILTTLGSLVPKFVRTDSDTIVDYVNE